MPEVTAEGEGESPAPPEEEAGLREEGEAPARPGFFRRLFGKPAEIPITATEPVAEAAEPEPTVAEVLRAPETAAPEGAEEVPEASPEPETPAEEERRGLFRRFRERLGRTREALSGGLARLFARRKVVDAELLEELEELLITADLGVETTLALMQGLQERLKRRELNDPERLKAALGEAMLGMLAAPAPRPREARPWVVLVVGVNGVGKTTTIAKLAHRERQAGREPLLIAADTFRAAAAEQLTAWGERLGVEVIRQQAGADPAAVVFDGLTAALARGVDTVFIDTAGRLHTKVNLMEELKKIHRTIGKKVPGAPHETYLVLDATTGQNALSQARLFQEAVGLSGLILTKLDGTAKGGVALAVVHETGLPLRYLGVGEGLDDLKPFDPEAFVAAILG
ncbi:MAG: signal recognition particle-docking protein FtsY [Desulfobaccales bacterium]